jgi:glycosyltransferase involved in cell wall biosynthesis
VKILILEPFNTGSHAAWARGYARHSGCDVDVLDLSGAHWKWRMHGGAVTLAQRFMALRDTPDLILATDMLDLPTFLALTRERSARVPVAIYFHENQLTYPWSPKDRDLKRNRDRHYGFINYTSALAADRVFFNSKYHMESFLAELGVFLRGFPDHRDLHRVEEIAAKSAVLPLGVDLSWFDDFAHEERRTDTPLVLWNHRWEYDKNPAHFFEALGILAGRGRRFDIVVAGEVFDVVPEEMKDGMARLIDRIRHAGYVESRAKYAQWLWRADVLPVTSNQDFFGASAVEAMYCNCLPLLPRRLAFPELVEGDCFYDGFDDFVEWLDDLLSFTDSYRTDRYRKQVARFDWCRIAPVYDDALGGVTASPSRPSDPLTRPTI